MIRKPDWQSALSAYLAEHEKTRFRYGQWDCCLFACDAIQAMTGVDVAAYYRGAYRDRRGALRAIAERTGVASIRCVAHSVTEIYEMPKRPISTAQRGDVVLLERGRDYSLGIVDLTGSKIAVAAAVGLLRIPLQSAVCAWQV